MATIAVPPVTRTLTLGDVLRDDIPFHRVLLKPTPGTATEADVEAIHRREGRLCELIDGMLVEKVMGATESGLALLLGHYLLSFVIPRRLGRVLGPDGTIRLAPGLVRIPDLAFFARDHLPNGRLPSDKVPAIIPDLAIEILSEGNTRSEMDQKLCDYFAAGVKLVWYFDPVDKLVRVYTGLGQVVVLDEAATLDGGAVLPGFALRISDWMRDADLAADMP